MDFDTIIFRTIDATPLEEVNPIYFAASIEQPDGRSLQIYGQRAKDYVMANNERRCQAMINLKELRVDWLRDYGRLLEDVDRLLTQDDRSQ